VTNAEKPPRRNPSVSEKEDSSSELAEERLSDHSLSPSAQRWGDHSGRESNGSARRVMGKEVRIAGPASVPSIVESDPDEGADMTITALKCTRRRTPAAMRPRMPRAHVLTPRLAVVYIG
jgi:hypothetical protein